MSTPEESLNDQDPDYVSTISNNQEQQKVYEENARNTTARKITAIVEKEFSREIDLKEKEILQIQERLQKALKTLHFLRYVIITNFYNHKQCQIPQAVETSKQTRIHPAIKSLLGKSPKFATIAEPAVPSTSTDSRFFSTDGSSASATTSTTTDSASKDEEDTNERDVKLRIDKRKLPSEEIQPRKIPRYVPPKNKAPPNTTCPSRGERYKICKRIIVGNISKWIPPDWREDAASHKWTMYVRGDKNEADISAFVSKVRFFLHPSYRPNDVVEVTSYPFHLSRRGWGEFPLRVQLHFKNTMNKPMDIIHHLKLDRTYTGLQTLGSETLVDLWIHATDSRNRDQNISDECVESSVNKMSVEETESNNDGNSELCDQPARCTEVSERLKPQFIASTSAEIQPKEEISSLEICKPSPSIDFMLSGDVKVKIEPNDTITDSNAFFTDLYETSLEEIRFHINREHDYSSKQYSKSRCCTVKEGNVTIEHFPEKECSFVSAMDSSAIGGNKKTSNTTAITASYECNGDIRSSDDCKSLTVLNTSDTMGDNSQVTSKHAVFQKHNNRKSLLLSDINKYLKNAESNSVPSKISEKSTENTTTTINGFCKLFNASLDRLNNLQKATNSSNTCSSHLKPLKISIPPLFAPSTSKRILLMKDKKLIPVEMRKKLADDDAKVSITNNIAKFDLSHSVSILKKPPASNVKANVEPKSTLGNKKETTVFAVKNTNSILLNVNYNVPALKIADSRDLQYDYGGVTRNNVVLPIGRRELPKSEDKDERTMQRAKVTLGKDRYRIQSKRETYESVLRMIENVNIVDTEAFVRFVIRRLPIVTRDAHDPEYRRLHPYACCSEEDFFMCNAGKQCALEWYRAKMIRHVMQRKSIPDDKLWSVREIMVWARLHGYTPNRDVFGMSDVAAKNDTKRLPDSSALTAVLDTCTEPVAFQNWLQTCRQNSNHRSTDMRVETKDMEIDVESIDESPCIERIDWRENGDNNENSNSLTLTPLELDESLIPLHNFVCENARDIGIKIRPEEIVPGVMYCAASRAIMRVIECFVEDLSRLSLAKAWERSSGNERPAIITLDDVRNALASREEFDIFTNEGLGSRQQLNTTN